MNLLIGIVVFAVVFVFGFAAMIGRFFNKVPRGKVLIRSGVGGAQIIRNGGFVIPMLHKAEMMDVSLKTLVIERHGVDGLICKDNMRADIKVAFYLKVDVEHDESIVAVAQNVGCERATNLQTLADLFEAKFSETLKTVGKQFNFVELYTERDKFRAQVLQVIGEKLNGYTLEDCAIDYLEQTPIDKLKEANILDAQGIEKITNLTSIERIKANKIRRETEQVITQQDVESKERVLELQRQLAEKEQSQRREIESIKAKEDAEIVRVQQEEHLKAENARIRTAEEIAINEQNRDREIAIAQKSKERAIAIEIERVEKDRMVEVKERERVTQLADIAKDKAVEEERKNIQDVIRERIAVEKTVVAEEELIKDVRAKKEVERQKLVAITTAEKEAEEAGIKMVKKAEAEKNAANLVAEQRLIEAETARKAAEKEAEAKKLMANARVAEEAAKGLAEAAAMEARAEARKKEAEAEAQAIERKMIAEAKGLEAQADALEKQGTKEAIVLEKKGEAEALRIKALAEAKKVEGQSEAEALKAKAEAEALRIKAEAEAREKEGESQAKVIELKGLAEAKRIATQADAMKHLEGIGREHEEFKLRLAAEKEIRLTQIGIQKDIAESQAKVLSQALISSKIEIIGGESMFFDKIVNAMAQGRALDTMFDNSQLLTGIKNAFLAEGDGGETLVDKIKNLVQKSGITSEDVKNLSIAALLFQLHQKSADEGEKSIIQTLLARAKETGIADMAANLLNAKS